MKEAVQLICVSTTAVQRKAQRYDTDLTGKMIPLVSSVIRLLKRSAVSHCLERLSLAAAVMWPVGVILLNKVSMSQKSFVSKKCVDIKPKRSG